MMIVRAIQRVQRLDGNQPIKVQILSEIDHTHRAMAQLLNYAVVGNRLTDHSVRILVPTEQLTPQLAEEV